VDIIHLSDWLKIALAGWVVISLLAAPFVGRFLAGALHERTADEPLRSARPRIRHRRREAPVSGPVAAPSSRP
jgi:hypothetical protein